MEKMEMQNFQSFCHLVSNLRLKLQKIGPANISHKKHAFQTN